MKCIRVQIVSALLVFAFSFAGCKTKTYAVSAADPLQEKLDSLISQITRVYQLPGLAAGVIKGNKIIYTGGFGLQKLGGTNPVTALTTFHMASVSKPFVAIAILQLADKGMLSLDDLLMKYIPYFTMQDARYKKITIRQMLTHTSGFPDVADYGWSKPQYDDGALERYIRDSVANCHLIAEPGAKFAYSNMAYDVLAEVIHQLSGVSFEAYMNEHIFKPCSMTHSTFVLDTSVLAASGHVLESSGRFVVSNVYPYNRCHAASSALHSNIEDMLKWEMALLNTNKLLSPQSYALFKNGLGLFVDDWKGKKLLNHSGSDLGFSSYAGFVPADSVAIVFMSNLHRYAPYEVITNSLLNTIYGLKNPPLEKPSLPVR